MAKEIVSQKDFGKEVGQIHEGLMKLRDAGMTHELWQKKIVEGRMASQIVQLLRGKEDWREDILAEWEGFYQDTFGIKADFSNLQIPEKEPGFNRLIIMAKGMTPQRLYDKCGEFFPCWKWTSDTLDNVVAYSERTSKDGAYAIWVRDCAEADEKFKNLSADKIKTRNITTETLEERLVHELKFFRESGEHLDIENITLCAGSRDSDSFVPGVDWRHGKLRVDWYNPDDAGGHLRSRRVVS